MTWQKLDPVLVQDIVRRCISGESSLDLAREFGVSRAAIDHHVRKRLGPRRRGKLSDQDRKTIVERWKKGEVAAHLAKEFGVGHSAVSKLILRETGRRIGRIRRKNEVFLPEDPVKLSYLAAMIDAEGCITRNSKSSACTWQVVITNTSPELEAWLSTLGGNFYYVSPARRHAEGQIRQCFEWKVTTAWNVYRILVAVFPYLVIKRGRAREAIEDVCSRFQFPMPNLALEHDDQLSLGV